MDTSYKQSSGREAMIGVITKQNTFLKRILYDVLYFMV